MTIATNIQGAFCNVDFESQNQLNDFILDLKGHVFHGNDLTYANLTNANLIGANLYRTTIVGVNLTGTDLSDANLKEVSGFGATFTGSCLENADLSEGQLNTADFQGASLVGARLIYISLKESNLAEANLQNANLNFAFLQKANLTSADLRGADLSNVELSGACLTGAKLEGAIGLGTKKGEIEFAKKLLAIFKSRKGYLEMDNWHGENCKTTHCLAGWAFPNETFPGAQASRMYPTLAQFFFKSNEEAMDALRAVASGELSVFPN